MSAAKKWEDGDYLQESFESSSIALVNNTEGDVQPPAAGIAAGGTT